MKSEDHIDALLEGRTPDEIHALANARAMARAANAALSRLTAGVPRVGAEDWANLKAVLLDRGGHPTVEHIAAEALAALVADDQEKFWPALLLTLRNVLAALPHLHPPKKAEEPLENRTEGTRTEAVDAAPGCD